jgi:hypothetical protein
MTIIIIATVINDNPHFQVLDIAPVLAIIALNQQAIPTALTKESMLAAVAREAQTVEQHPTG